MSDISKLFFLNGSLRENKQSKYPYLTLLRQGLSSLGVTYPSGSSSIIDWGNINGTLSNQTDLQTALNTKQPTLVSATNIKTINGTTLLGSGDLVISGSGGGAATSLESGTVPTEVGTIFSDSFSGTSLSALWGGLTTGVTVNNKLIVASGMSDWTRYIKLAKWHFYEKADWNFDFKSITKNAGDGWGIHQDTTTFLLLYSSSVYLKVDLGNGSDSGRVLFGSTAGGSEYGKSQALAFSAGDDLRLTIKRTPWNTVTILENITTPATPKAYGEFNLPCWGTEGRYRLTFLGGQQEFTNIGLYSKGRNFGSTHGVLFIGDSITSGSGASTVDRRWSNVVMRSQQHFFENLGVGSWISGTMTAAMLTEFISKINPKYVVINYGYNDHAQAVSTGTYQTNLQTLATTAQGLGCTVIFVSPFPNANTDSTSYATAMAAAATATSSKYISIREATSVGGLGILANPEYLIDGIHPNDNGYEKIGLEVMKQAPELGIDIMADLNNQSVKSHSLPAGLINEDLVTIDAYGRYKRTPRKQITATFVRLQPTIYESQIGGIGITGDIVTGGTWQQKRTGGLRIGCNNGTAATDDSNVLITNAGTGGVGYPQFYNSIIGIDNAWLNISNTKGAISGSISGNRNLLWMSVITNGSTLSGSDNTLLNHPNSITTGSANFYVGPANGVTTGSYNIGIIPIMNASGGSSVGNLVTTLTGSILIGTPFDYTGAEAIYDGEVVISAYNRSGTRIYNFGAKGGMQTTVIWRAGFQGGTNAVGSELKIQAGRGTGNAIGGDIIFERSVAGASGSTPSSTFEEKFRVGDGIKTIQPSGSGNAFWKLGTLITAAVTADTTRYLEVSVAGVVYKVIVSS